MWLKGQLSRAPVLWLPNPDFANHEIEIPHDSRYYVLKVNYLRLLGARIESDDGP